MSTSVTVGGLTYFVPAVGENNWGQNVTDLLIAITQNISGGGFFTVVTVASSPITVLSGRTYLVDTSGARTLNLPAPAVGAYLLVRDKTGSASTNAITLHRNGAEQIDGASADKTLIRNNGTWIVLSDGTNWYTLNQFSDSGIVASTGYLRLANLDQIAWRNVANSANLTLGIDGSNNLIYNSAILALTSGWAPGTFIVTTGGGVLTTLAPPIIIAFGGTNSIAALNNNRVMQSSGGAIVEAAAITATRALVSDANGIPVATAVTTTEIGFVSGVTSAIQTQLNNIAAGTLGRNRIINGDMRISQQAGGALVSVNSNADFWPVDMLRCGGQVADGVYSIQQLSATPPAGFLNYVRAIVTTADAAIAAGQLYAMTIAIEGNNCRDLLYGSASAKTITLSFWVRSSLTGAFSGALSNSPTDRSYPFSFTINSANVWEQKTITITGDLTGTWLTDNGIGIRVYFDLGAGTTRRAAAGAWAAGSNVIGVTGAVSLIATNAATFDLTGVQFEVGSVATPFEFRPMAVELLMCQRYFVRLGGSTSADPISLAHAISATVAYCLRPLPVMMRAAPTGIVNNPTNFTTGNAAGGTINCTALTFSSASTLMVQLNATVAAGLVAGNASNLLSGTANATIDVSAQI